jgi:hypothetical protein
MVFPYSWNIQTMVIAIIIVGSLFARTVAYNYDFSLSVKENTFTYNLFHKAVKRQPIGMKKPRALSSIVLYKTQQTEDLQHHFPLKALLFQTVRPHTLQLSLQTVPYLAPPTAQALPPPDDICVLNTIFRI